MSHAQKTIVFLLRKPPCFNVLLGLNNCSSQKLNPKKPGAGRGERGIRWASQVILQSTVISVPFWTKQAGQPTSEQSSDSHSLPGMS